MSTSETITRTDLTNILNEVLPSTHGIGISKGSWTSSGTSAYNVKVTSDLTLSKGLYLVTLHTPFVASGTGYIGLRINGTADNSSVIVAPTNEYARGAFLVNISAQSTVAGYSEGSQAVTYSVLERGGIEAIQLVRYTESPEADYIVEQGTSGMWTYRKWNSGIAECWGYKSISKTFKSWGSWYYVQAEADNYPTGLFTTVTNVQGQLTMASADTISSVVGGAPSTSKPPSITGVRPTNATNTYAGLAYWNAKGTWK